MQKQKQYQFPDVVSSLPIPADEYQRLVAVHSLNLLDTPAEHAFDDLVQLATQICGAPIGLMSLVDADRVFHKSQIGIDIPEVSRNLTFCEHTIRQDDVMIVEDASIDPRFATNPFVTAPGGVRFYAGTPLEVPTGEKIGSLCVVDIIPRHLGEDQVRSLRTLARQMNVSLALRLEKIMLQRALTALGESERMLRAFMDAMPVEAHLKDEKGRILFYNKKLADRFGVTTQDWLGKTSRDLWSAELAEQIISEEAAVMEEGIVRESCITTPGNDQQMIYWRTLKIPFTRHDGCGMVATIAMDVTTEVLHRREMEDANKRLEKMAQIDSLTQLPNRRSFEQRLEEMVSLARRSGQPLSLLFIDVDNFKYLNDTYGHRDGDEVLRRVGALLAATKRVPDVAARYGGEEFAVLLPHTTSSGAITAAERIVEAVRHEDWGKFHVTVSVGGAEFQEEMSHDELVRAADAALYEAKSKGKNQAILSRS